MMRKLTQVKIMNISEGKIMYKKTFALFILLSILITTIAFSKTTYTREFKKTITFESQGNIEVKTTNGKIDVTSWNSNDVEIFAEIKVKASSQREADRILEKVEIRIDRSNGRLIIEPEYPKRDDDDSFWDHIFDSDRKPTVNFTIQVPEQTNLNLRSTNGHVAASDIEGEIILKTTNGGIEADHLKGSVDANTTNGSVSINITQFSRQDRVDLNTTNGSIKLYLPSEVKAEVKASTVNGSIQTDFPLTVQGKISRKRLNGEINGGGGLIELSTVNGSISIYER